MRMVDVAKLQPWTGLGATAYSRFAKAIGVVVVWRNRARERHALRRLNDHYLRDIGLTRHEAMIECDKPFWRA